MRHRSNLDILRAVAVCTVLIDHAAATLQLHPGYNNRAVLDFTAQIGQVGVTSFFVHTSLVLMDSLKRLHETEKFVTFRFYVRRFFRIYPLSVFTILLALLFHIPSNTWGVIDPVTGLGIAANLLLVQNLITGASIVAPLWSLPYEVQMYVVLPALYLVTRSRRPVLYIGGLIGFFCAVAVTLALTFGHLNMAAYVPCFLCGVLAYAMLDRVKPRLPAILWPVLLVALIVAFCVVNEYIESPYWLVWIVSLILGVSIPIFKNSTSKIANTVAETVARYSYGMYLLHVPVLYLVFFRMDMQSIPLGIALFLAITSAASIACYHFIEKPAIDLGRRLSSSDALAHKGIEPPKVAS